MRFMAEEADDSWSPLMGAAVALNEMFNTLMQAGFNEDQALKLVSNIIIDSFLEPSTDDDDN